MIPRDERGGAGIICPWLQAPKKKATLYPLSSRLLSPRPVHNDPFHQSLAYGEEVAVLNSFQTVTGWRSLHGR